MKQKKYIYSMRAIVLVLLFTAPLLVNPLHFVFVKHKTPHNHSGVKAMVAEKEQDCSYCDFHFSGFITGFQLYEPTHFINHLYKAVTAFTYCIVPVFIIRLYSGRAPPMVTVLLSFP
ncbi:hypothetical protein GR160_18575 [Flavobacterium sp. Sd200]|uniref:hypothetical protein n=1 Tax=Flavobacterium sp. Sd200 TaxID=2692211 RepID=UPI00136F2D55|nr:hypothetical protein [Flavobacterium sp. Sd200]MXN93239.1 hypothetical protein [Flavobacterium sp. Sd200]